MTFSWLGSISRMLRPTNISQDRERYYFDSKPERTKAERIKLSPLQSNNPTIIIHDNSLQVITSPHLSIVARLPSIAVVD